MGSILLGFEQGKELHRRILAHRALISFAWASNLLLRAILQPHFRIEVRIELSKRLF